MGPRRAKEVDMNAQRVTFFVVDDDEVATLAIMRALDQLGIGNPVVLARDGEEALRRLRDPNGPKSPLIILLDLNMPNMDGIELLGQMRTDPALSKTVVFVLTTSDAPSDIDTMYRLGISGYVLKEDALSSIKPAVEMVRDFAAVVTLPP